MKRREPLEHLPSREREPGSDPNRKAHPRGANRQYRKGATVMKAVIYARVSKADQTCDNQLLELRRNVEARELDRPGVT